MKDYTIYFDGIWTDRTYEDYNLRNKWNSFCMSIDIPNDQWVLYINGKSNNTYLHNKSRKLNDRFSDRTDLPMVIRLGHYYFDNKPILGTILDFHVWDRYLHHKFYFTKRTTTSPLHCLLLVLTLYCSGWVYLNVYIRVTALTGGI